MSSKSAPFAETLNRRIKLWAPCKVLSFFAAFDLLLKLNLTRTADGSNHPSALNWNLITFVPVPFPV